MATVSWFGGFGDGNNWGDGGNWSLLTVPGIGDDVIISNKLDSRVLLQDGTTRTCNSVTIDSGDTLFVGTLSTLVAESFITVGTSQGATLQVCNGGSLEIANDGQLNVGGVLNGADGYGTLLIGADATQSAVSHGTIFPTRVALNSVNSLLLFKANDSFTFSNTIINSGSVTQQGVGTTVTLTGANSYAGSTTISSGASLQVGVGGTAGTIGGGIVVDNGALVFKRSDTNFLGNTIIGGGTLEFGGGGTFELLANSSFTGTATVDPGTVLVLGGGGSAGTLGGGSIVDNGTLDFFRNDSSIVTTSISGSGGVRNFTGTTTLAANNTYTGATLVVSGTLKAGNIHGLGTNSATEVFGGATLDINGFGVSIFTLTGGGTIDNSSSTAARLAVTDNLSTTFTGTLKNTGSGGLGLFKGGSGTLTLTAANSYRGITEVNNGALNIQNSGALGLATTLVQVDGGASLQLQGGLNLGVKPVILVGSGPSGSGALRNISGSNTVGGSISIASQATLINADAGLLTLSGNITGSVGLTLGGGGNITLSGALQYGGSLNKSGTGTLILSGTNTYTGATTVGSGTLDIKSGQALGGFAQGTTVDAGATLQLDGGIGTGNEAFTLNGTGAANSGALDSRTGTNTINGPITLATDARIDADGSSTLSVNNSVGGAGTNLTVGGSGTVNLGGAVQLGAGALTKDGTGTLQLSGPNSYTGPTTVSAGTLTVVNINVPNFVGTLGSDAVSVATGAVLRFTNLDMVDDDYIINNLIRGGGTVDFTSPPGSVTSLGNTNTYTGFTTIESGIVNIFNNAVFGTSAVTMTGGAIRATFDRRTLANTFTLIGVIGVGAATDITGAITLAGNTIITPAENAGDSVWSGTLDTGGHRFATGDVGPNTAGGSWSGQNFTLSGVISGAGGVTQNSAGTLILSGNNTYSGGTIVQSGTLNVGSNSTLGSSQGATNVSGGTLELNANTITVGAFELDNGTVHLTGSLIVTGTATINAGLTGTPMITGSGKVITNGTAAIGILAIGGSVLFRNNGSVTQTGTITLGDSSNAAAQITNAPGKTWTIAGDIGIAAGNAVATFNNGAATLQKFSGTGVSAIGVNVANLAGTAAFININSGTLNFTGATNNFTADAISGAGTFAIGGGGTSTIGAGTTITTAGWTIGKVGTTVNLGLSLTYAGNFGQTNLTTLNLGANTLTLTGPALFNLGPVGSPVINGTGKLITNGTDSLGAFTLAGSVLLRNNGGVTQTGNITLGDGSNGAAQVTNAAGKSWVLTADVGIVKGSTTALFNTGGGGFSKTGGTGVSIIGVNVINANATTSQIEVASGTLDFAGTVSGAQAFKIDAGRTLQFDSSVATGSAVTFAGAGGTLRLNDAQDFKGAITGFGSGQSLDLASIAYASPGTTLVYAGSTLTVAAGGKTASLAIGTGYTPTSFHLANDTHGGSLVTYG